MYNKQHILEDNAEYITLQYKNPEVTQVDIAKHLGVSPCTLNRFAKAKGFSKVLKSKWDFSSIEWLSKNYNLSYKELEEHLNLDGETIRMKLNELGIKRTTKYRPFKLDMNDTEFLNDLDDPRMCAPDIQTKYATKYGIGISRIHQLRKQRGIKLQVNTLSRESVSEFRVKCILDELDLAYIKEKKFGKYSVDFYLGFKLCLEVQGRYWHSKPNRIDTDKRKREFLESKGYTILYIWDDEITTAKEYIISALQKRGLPVL